MAGLMLPQGGGFLEKSQRNQQMAISAYGQIRPKQETEYTPAGKTAGGALSAGAGMGLAGYQMGSMIGGAAAGGAAAGGAAAGAAGGAAGGAATGATAGSSAGPWGAVIGAGIGILAYLLS